MSDVSRPSPRAQGFTHIFWALVYAALLIGVTWFLKHNPVAGPAVWGLAVLPSLPIAALMLATWRHIRDSDEYVRALQTKRIVYASALVLFVATVWGLLQSLAEIGPLDPLFAFPAAWFAYGSMCLFVKDVR